jgi:hypothetical protein
MRNQFYYTRTEEKLEPEMIIKVYSESFNINNVIRTVAMEDGRHLVLLNDIHERSIEVPDINLKTNKMMGYKRERNTYQSEIFLTAEDAERLKKLTEILE